MSNDRLCTFALFLVLLSLYLAFSGDRYSDFQASDEAVMFEATYTLVERISPKALVTAGSLRPNLQKAYEGQEAKYGLGQSLAAIPLYLLARGMIALLPDSISGAAVAFPLACATNALICAAIGAMLFVVARRLGYGRRPAIAAALIVGLATNIAPYSKTFFSEPLVALSLLGAVGALAIPRGESPSARTGFRVGAWLALAILTRVDNVTVIPVFLAGLWLGTGKSERTRAFRATIGFAVPLALIAAFIAWTNWLRSEPGSGGGYGGEGFSTPFLAGLYGLLFSPAHGLFWFSPPVAIALIYASRFHRRHQRITFVIFATVAVKLLLFSKWWNWFGGWSPGSRFLLPIVPLVILVLLEPLSRWRRLRGVERVVIVAVVAIGFVVQVSGQLAAPNAFHGNVQFLAGSAQQAATGRPQPIADREQLLMFSPTLSPLVGNWKLIANGQLDWFGMRFSQFFPGYLLWVILGGLGLLFAGGATLLDLSWLAKRREETATIAPEDDPQSATPGPKTRADLPQAIPKVARGFLILNILVFAMLAGAMLRNGLWRTEHKAPGHAGGSKIVSSVYLQDDFEPQPDSRARTTSWRGYIEAPTTGEYTFYVLVWGSFDFRVANRLVLQNPPEAAGGRRSMRAETHLTRGVHPLTLTYHKRAPDTFPPGRREPRLLHLYWTIPGGGEFQKVIGRSWFYPSRPGTVRWLIALLWRVKMGLPIASVLVLWWIWIHLSLLAENARKTEESELAETPSS